jgi:FtsH-binding integral membrane protein
VFNQDPNRPDRYDAQRPAGSQPSWGTPSGLPPQGQTGFGPQGPGAFPQYAPSLPGAVPTTLAREGFLTMSFVWMFAALLLSAATAAVVMVNPTALGFVAQNFFILIIAELALVFGISMAINRLGAVPALGLLFVYAILNGATISLVVLAYLSRGSVGGVVSAFLGASAIFGAAALYGVVTKRDLTSLGGILFVGLIGIIVASLVNAFLIPSGTFSFIIGIVGVLIFTGLTAYDVQRINNGGLAWIKTRESASVVGALHLYLDFVNLFLMLLRVFNSRD